MNKKLYFSLLAFIILFTSGIFLYYKLKNTQATLIAAPILVAMMPVTYTACTYIPPTPTTPPLCVGEYLLCNSRPELASSPILCASYAEVSGMLVFGTASAILEPLAALSAAGVTNGGIMIAGGLLPYTMETGFVASLIKCVGCE